MGWLGKLLGSAAKSAAETAVEQVIPSLIEAHIERFRRAIDQSENPAKKQQLVRDLAYYEGLKAKNNTSKE